LLQWFRRRWNWWHWCSGRRRRWGVADYNRMLDRTTAWVSGKLPTRAGLHGAPAIPQVSWCGEYIAMYNEICL